MTSFTHSIYYFLIYFFRLTFKIYFYSTPLYVAPEIICGARYDEKIDVWAIGVLAYHMAIGRHPFQGRDQDETLDNIEKHKAIQFKGKKWVCANIIFEFLEIVQHIWRLIGVMTFYFLFC